MLGTLLVCVDGSLSSPEGPDIGVSQNLAYILRCAQNNGSMLGFPILGIESHHQDPPCTVNLIMVFQGIEGVCRVG